MSGQYADYLYVDAADEYVDAAADASGCSIKKVG